MRLIRNKKTIEKIEGVSRRGMAPKEKWYFNLFQRRMFVILLLAVQIACFVYFIVSSSLESQVIRNLLSIISIAVALYVVSRDTPPAFRTIWICMVLAFPVFGGLLYILFASQASTRKFSKLLYMADKRRKEYSEQDSGLLERLSTKEGFDASGIKYLENCCGYPVYDNTESKYYPSGETFFADLLPELEKAEKYIFLEFFIIQEGTMWDTVLEILERKAKQGVDVRVIYDDVGCFLTLPREYPKILASKGIKCHIFSPFKPVLTSIQNNRDHRKIVAIDGKVAFTGGINLADEYINAYERFGHWKDAAVKLTGKAAWSLTVIFLSMWELYSGKDEDYHSFAPEELPLASDEGMGYVQPYADSPLDKEDIAEHVYLKIIQRANDYVYITTPYLIINEVIQNALCLAAKSGVDVRIITPHIADKVLVHRTTRSYYPLLIEAGVRIYEYTPGFIHSKTMVSDGKVVAIGSANLDYRSLNLHFECGTCIYDCEKIADDMKKDFLNTLAVSHEISKEDCKNIKFGGFLNQLLRLFAPIM